MLLKCCCTFCWCQTASFQHSFCKLRKYILNIVLVVISSKMQFLFLELWSIGDVYFTGRPAEATHTRNVSQLPDPLSSLSAFRTFCSRLVLPSVFPHTRSNILSRLNGNNHRDRGQHVSELRCQACERNVLCWSLLTEPFRPSQKLQLQNLTLVE